MDDQPYQPPKEGFYITDAFTDHAVQFLDQYGRDDKPFFLYLAYTAPHWPLHALPEDIAKYKGKYLKGWDAAPRGAVSAHGQDGPDQRQVEDVTARPGEPAVGQGEGQGADGPEDGRLRRPDRADGSRHRAGPRQDQGARRQEQHAGDVPRRQRRLRRGRAARLRQSQERPAARRGGFLHELRPVLGQRQQHALPPLQALGPRGRHFDAVHRLLARRDQEPRRRSPTRSGISSTSWPRASMSPAPAIRATTRARS